MIKGENIHDATVQAIEERVNNQMFKFDHKESEGLKDEIELYLMESGLTPSQIHRLKHAKSKLNNIESKTFMESNHILFKKFILFIQFDKINE